MEALARSPSRRPDPPRRLLDAIGALVTANALPRRHPQPDQLPTLLGMIENICVGRTCRFSGGRGAGFTVKNFPLQMYVKRGVPRRQGHGL